MSLAHARSSYLCQVRGCLTVYCCRPGRLQRVRDQFFDVNFTPGCAQLQRSELTGVTANKHSISLAAIAKNFDRGPIQDTSQLEFFIPSRTRLGSFRAAQYRRSWLINILPTANTHQYRATG